jgi:hypothetical protein
MTPPTPPCDCAPREELQRASLDALLCAPPPAPSASALEASRSPSPADAPPAPITPRAAAEASRARAAAAQSSLLTPPALPMPRLVTFVTHDAPELANLRDSCAATRAPLDVVFTPQRFGPRHGWGPRLLALHAYVSDERRRMRASCSSWWTASTCSSSETCASPPRSSPR